LQFVSSGDWAQIFFSATPVVELVVRVSVVYLFLYFLLRFVLKRESGALGLTDLLVIVLIADAVQNGMAGEYRTILGALVVSTTIVFWDYVLSWLSFRSPRLRRLIRPGPLLLVKNGRPIKRALQSELITEEELMGELRLQGIDRIEDVREAYMEENGQISVIARRLEQQSEVPRAKSKRRIVE